MTSFWGYGRGSISSAMQNMADSMSTAGRRESAEVRSGVAELEERLDRLTLICMAMWDILKEKGGLVEQELMDRMQQIDLADGVADGKVTRTVAKCHNCGRTMSPRHNKCLYCGATKLERTAFDSLS